MEWRLWQLADSAFPTGGFAHSGGLEAALQLGEVRSTAEFEKFLREAIEQAARSLLPFVSAAHAEPHRLQELDNQLEAFLSSEIINRASRVQGRTFFATCLRSFALPELQQLQYKLKQTNQHYALTLGATLAALGVALELSQRLFLYTTLRGILSAAVRLGVIGPYAAQALQWEMGPHLELVLKAHCNLGPHEAAQTAPLLEILQSNHDRLYSKLFQS